MKLGTKRKIGILLDRGLKWGHGPLRFFAQPRAEGRPAMGILISRKAYRKAVDRNRLRRLFREAWRQAPKGKPWDILISVQKGIDLKRTKLKEAQEWLISGLKKRRLLD